MSYSQFERKNAVPERKRASAVESQSGSPYDTYAARDALFEDLKDHVKDIINKQQTAPLIDLLPLLKTGDLIGAITELRHVNDAYQNIHSRNLNLKTWDANFLLRKSAARSSAGVKEHYANWAIMGLNYLYTAKKIVALMRGQKLSDEEENYINNQAVKFYNAMQSSNDPEVEFARVVHSVAVPFVSTLLPNANAKKLLTDARDFNNFDHVTTPVVTLIDVPFHEKLSASRKKQFLQIDVPMTGQLNQELEAQLSKLANAKISEDDLNNILWYRALQEHTKKLVRAHAQDILDGCMIPTQLRKFLPGLRNAGHERIYDFETGELVYEGYHSGTLGHQLTAGNDKATAESVQQVHKLSGAKHTVILSLLSPARRGEDLALIKQIEAAVKDQPNIHFACLPVNGLRRISSLKTEGLEFVYDQAKAMLHEEKVSNKTNGSALKKAIEDYDLVKAGSTLFEKENTNLLLVHAVSELARCINAVKGENYIAIKSECQSGKDRVALARTMSATKAIFNHIVRSSGVKTVDLKTSLQQERLIRRTLAQSAHVKIQAGMQGGTIGAAGIKKDSTSGVPASWPDGHTQLMEQTASYNKELPPNPSKKVSKLKIFLGVLGVLGGIGLCLTGVGAIPLLAGLGISAAAGGGTGVAAGLLSTIFSIFSLKQDKKKSSWFARNENLNPMKYDAPPQPKKTTQKSDFVGTVGKATKSLAGDKSTQVLNARANPSVVIVRSTSIAVAQPANNPHVVADPGVTRTNKRAM